MGYQNIFVNHQAPEWDHVTLALILAIFFNITAFYLYRKHAGEMVDEL